MAIGGGIDLRGTITASNWGIFAGNAALSMYNFLTRPGTGGGSPATGMGTSAIAPSTPGYLSRAWTTTKHGVVSGLYDGAGTVLYSIPLYGMYKTASRLVDLGDKVRTLVGPVYELHRLYDAANGDFSETAHDLTLFTASAAIGFLVPGETPFLSRTTESLPEAPADVPPPEVGSPTAEPGQWMPVNESMSARALAYQIQIGGRAGEAYVVNGVKFDSFEDGMLLDGKGPGYARFVRDGVFRDWWRGADEFVRRAHSQFRAAGPTPIRWLFAEDLAAAATRALFGDAGITWIEIVVEPPVTH